ncbi:sulfotransferase [Cytobacillus sp. Hm23]
MTNKIFCIGRNKTGTTSLKKAFEDLGYHVGDQREAENLLVNFLEKDIETIIDYCNYAEVFQDFPFSWPETYKFLDKAFPNSKFILSVRDDASQWYKSITKFHSKLFADGKRIPTKKDLMNATYIFKGRPWITHKAIFGDTGNDTYDKDILTKHYNQHNKDVIEYFKDRPNDLLVINLAEAGSYERFCKFLDVNPLYDDFPWENRTSAIRK